MRLRIAIVVAGMVFVSLSSGRCVAQATSENPTVQETRAVEEKDGRESEGAKPGNSDTNSEDAKEKSGDSDPKAASEASRDQATGEDPTRPQTGETRTMSYWMEKKMEYSQKILRALASGDFETIETSAEQLRLLSRVEGFVRRQNPEYQVQLEMFGRHCRQLERKSRDQDLSGVTLAFHQLTVSCVECHRSIREGNDAPARNGDREIGSIRDEP